MVNQHLRPVIENKTGNGNDGTKISSNIGLKGSSRTVQKWIEIKLEAMQKS